MKRVHAATTLPRAKDLRLTRSFEREWQGLPPRIKKVAKAKIALLVQHPKHPSLRVHRLRAIPDLWICYVSMSYRVIYQMQQGQLWLVRIGGHEVVDQIRAHPPRAPV